MTVNPPLTVILAQPRGFCAGVDRAIDIVEEALRLYGPPIYVRHEIVHNKWVVDDLRNKGVIFVEEISEVPEGAITVFSAHGISEKVENEAKLRNLPVIDATCPLVTKVHLQAQRYEREGHEIILIGHAGHPEVEGTSGRVKKVYLVESVNDVATLEIERPDSLSYVTQTTLSMDDTKLIIDALKAKFPAIQGPDVKDICYATQNRQNAVKELVGHMDLLLVIGSQNSSNSNRLRDLGEEHGVPSYLINSYAEIDSAWLANVSRLAITAGASAPERLVEEILDHLAESYHIELKTLGSVQEHVHFKLPPEVTVRPFAQKLKAAGE